MPVGVSYSEAINFTQESVNNYFLSWWAILLKKLCKFRRRGFTGVTITQRDDYQMSELGQNFRHENSA